MPLTTKFSKILSGLLSVTFITSLLLPLPQTTLANATNAPSLQTVTSGIQCLDLSQATPGTSVEGLNAVMANLNISTTGNAIVLAEGIGPRAYGSPNGANSIINGSIGALGGGFADIDQIHDYTFTFTPGITIDYFSLRLLDYGDFNPNMASEHHVNLIAYNGNGQQIDNDILSFTSDGQRIPHGGSAGDLWLTGDATTAQPGEPGNYTFTVTGGGITRVELQFTSDLGDGATDPLFALSVLCFATEETPPAPPNTTCVDFAQLAPGTSVEGLGALNPALNISATGNAVALAEAVSPRAWGAPNGPNNIMNGGVDTVLGGFADIDKLHEYTFSFAPNTSVDYFSLQMLDFGDFNPNLASEHRVDLVAYDTNNQIVDLDSLFFTSDGQRIPHGGSAGDLWLTGDAVTSQPGQPGNYTFAVAGTNINRLELQFSSNLGPGSTDPLFGLSVLCFETESTPSTPTEVCADFTVLPPGASVEGLGAINPDLNISSTGNAVALAEGADPRAYGAPNGANSISNGGVDTLLAGFSDIDQLHEYTFGFAPNMSVSQFSLQMLDFGDFNPALATEHRVELAAYDSNDQLVDSDTLFFTSDGQRIPHGGSAGDLWLTADAITSQPGQPGNYTFTVAGTGITHLELQFSSDLGVGVTDPFFGFSVLCFIPEETPPPPPTDTPQTCEDLGYTTVAEDSWTEHVIRGMEPIMLGYARPSEADYAIVNTGWEWTGLPGQNQTTEMHSVVTPFGAVTSQDYGNEELEGQILWFGAPQGAFDQPSLQLTIDYAGDGSQPDSHRSHGRIAWCDNPAIDPPPPPEPLTCADIGLEAVSTADWRQHVIRDMTPVANNFAQPDEANYVIVNTAWAWSGLPNQHQATEKHSVTTPLGTAVSDDYGNEELDGKLIWYDALQGAFGAGSLPVAIDYAGDGSDPGSHISSGLVNWCLDPNAPDVSSTLLQPLGDNGAQVKIAYSCSDAAPTLVSATLNDYAVEDGQTLWLVPNDNAFANTVDGGLTAIYGPAFSLVVTCAAADGAQSTAIVTPDLGD